MPRVNCRCGEKLSVQLDGLDRVTCPKCGAKIRLRRLDSSSPVIRFDDGYLRFQCPCGRRLKVPSTDRPVAGKCPDCGRVVPVPNETTSKNINGFQREGSPNDAEVRTEELDAAAVLQLQQWSLQYAGDHSRPSTPASTSAKTEIIKTDVEAPAHIELAQRSPLPPTSAVKFEAGFRVCPRCKKPVHLQAPLHVANVAYSFQGNKGPWLRIKAVAITFQHF